MSVDRDILDDLQAAVRGVLSRHRGTDGHRAVVENDGYDVLLWRRMCELGWLGTMVDARHGGAGLGLAAAAAIAEELAYASTCVPFISSAVLSACALESAGGDVADAWLPRLATGDAIGALCCTGRAGIADPQLVDVVARPQANGQLTLEGQACFVADGAFADVLLVVARSPLGEIVVALVDAGAAAVRVAPVPTINRAHRLAHVALSGVHVPPADVVARGDAAAAVLDHVMPRAVVAVAADAHGAARRAFDLAREYATQRRQFDRPIGSFQAIKHKLADMYTLVTGCEACVDAAALAIDRDDPIHRRTVATAGSFVRNAASRVVGESMQIHGAIGYTWEHECHLLLKRAKFDERYLVSVWASRDLLADVVLNGVRGDDVACAEASRAATVGIP